MHKRILGCPDNSLHIFFNSAAGRGELAFSLVNTKYQSHSSTRILTLPPKPDHPWRRKNPIGKARYRYQKTHLKEFYRKILNL